MNTVIVLIVNNWGSIGDILLRTPTFYVQVGVNDVQLAKRCLMYLLSYRIVIFFIQILSLQIMWRIFNRTSNKKSFITEKAKSIPHIGLVVDNG